MVAPLCAQTYNRESAAEANTAWLSEKITTGKKFQLRAGTLYVDGTATTREMVGCGRFETVGSSSYPVDETLTGGITKIVQLGSGPVFNIVGHGFYAEGPIEIHGDGVSAAIEIQSGESPATGGHTFRNIQFYNWGTAIKACGESDHDNDQHADDVLVDHCRTFNCRKFIRSENQQAVNWKLRDCSVCVLGESDTSVIVADLQYGGNMTIDGLMILHQNCVIFNLGDDSYSPNTRRLICRDFWRDRIGAADHYLTLFKYSGSANDYVWDVEVTGNAPVNDDYPLDHDRLIEVTEGLDDSLFDTTGVRFPGE